MAELRSIKSSAKIETAEMTEIVETTVMILVSKKWLFEVVLNLTGKTLAAATV